MKILITCPRAPVSIEWIRIFEKSGDEVILVDSISFPIAKYYHNTKFIKIPSPSFEFEKYKAKMIELIEEVDWVIPNCEDIFFLSKVRDAITTDTFFFMPEQELLLELHNKFTFFKHLNSYVKYPKTELLTDIKDIKVEHESILKPVFSRFGASVIRDITPQHLKEIKITAQYPWVEQEKIVGKALCNYALILNGKLLAHVAYEPQYLLNGAAATYFEPYFDERLENFINTFAKESNYTGQVAFDFIDDGKDLYILECNPRATSGLHILREGLSFENRTFNYKKSTKPRAYRVGYMLYLLFGFKAFKSANFKTLNKDFKRAKDVLQGVSLYGQMVSFLAMIGRAIYRRKDMTTASTIDIEFNG